MENYHVTLIFNEPVLLDSESEDAGGEVEVTADVEADSSFLENFSFDERRDTAGDEVPDSDTLSLPMLPSLIFTFKL